MDIHQIRKQVFNIFGFILISGFGMSQTPGQKDPGHKPGWVLESEWPKLPVGYSLSQPGGIGIDSKQNIFVFHRPGRRWKMLEDEFPDSLISSNTVLMIDRNSGKIINAWGANLFIMPHGLTVDKQDNVWVTDVGLHQIFKFSHDGVLLMKLGEAKIPGNDSRHFNRPTDVAVTKDGSFYVTDGYRNSRVIKFSKEGKYLFEWGRKGNKPGEFIIPHAIDLDSMGNVYVADRENNRVQEFDANGKFIREWKDKSLSKLYSVTIFQKNQQMFAVDYLVVLDVVIKGSNIIQFDPDGHIISEFGRSGSYSGPTCRYHDLAIDRDGNIYVGDILGNCIQKFTYTP
jgi:DNA-binding beta-propeller fold protein YncE